MLSRYLNSEPATPVERLLCNQVETPGHTINHGQRSSDGKRHVQTANSGTGVGGASKKL
jgi:hypothetical protein